MKKIVVFFAAVILLSSCNALRPTVYAAYYVENLPDSKATVQVGTSNSQENNYWGDPPELSSDIYFYKSNLNTGYMEHGQGYGPDVLLTNNL